MDPEKQIAQALIENNLSWPEWLDGVAVAKQVKELGVPSKQLQKSIEAATELKDPDFRAAAFDLLELGKRTGKRGKELAVYIGELSTQSLALERDNAAKEKLKSNLERNINQYQQKLRDEKKKLESEQVKNRRILEEDTKRLGQQLKQNNQTRENVGQSITLANKLKGIGLDMPTFTSIVEEVSQNREIGLALGKEISNQIIKYGAFLKAKEMAKGELKSIKANADGLSQIESGWRKALSLLDGQITRKKGEFDKLMEEIKAGEDISKSQSEQIKAKRWQYEFFETFVSMLLNSPSAAKKEDLISGSEASALRAVSLMIKTLEENGWKHSTKTAPEERRGIFITTVMGAYLRSIHCEYCGASFIVNKNCDFSHHYCRYYCCPVCHFSVYTKPDDGFLESMTSPDLAERLQVIRKLLDLEAPYLAKLRKLAKILPEDALKALPEDEEVKWQLSEGGDLILRSKP